MRNTSTTKYANRVSKHNEASVKKRISPESNKVYLLIVYILVLLYLSKKNFVRAADILPNSFFEEDMIRSRLHTSLDKMKGIEDFGNVSDTGFEEKNLCGSIIGEGLPIDINSYTGNKPEIEQNTEENQSRDSAPRTYNEIDNHFMPERFLNTNDNSINPIHGVPIFSDKDQNHTQNEISKQDSTAEGENRTGYTENMFPSKNRDQNNYSDELNMRNSLLKKSMNSLKSAVFQDQLLKKIQKKKEAGIKLLKNSKDRIDALDYLSSVPQSSSEHHREHIKYTRESESSDKSSDRSKNKESRKILISKKLRKQIQKRRKKFMYEHSNLLKDPKSDSEDSSFTPSGRNRSRKPIYNRKKRGKNNKHKRTKKNQEGTVSIRIVKNNENNTSDSERNDSSSLNRKEDNMSVDMDSSSEGYIELDSDVKNVSISFI